MIDKNKNKSALAGAAGAAIVAGVAVASAFVLKDKKNREKVKKVLTNVKDQAVDYMDDMQKRTDKKEKEIEEKLIQATAKTKKEGEKYGDN
jgi:F0F1-type ATP synthase membrane subunit a